MTLSHTWQLPHDASLLDASAHAGSVDITHAMVPLPPEILPTRHNPPVTASAIYQGLDYHAHARWASLIPDAASIRSLEVQLHGNAAHGSPWPLIQPTSRILFQAHRSSSTSIQVQPRVMLGLRHWLFPVSLSFTQHKADSSSESCLERPPHIIQLSLSSVARAWHALLPELPVEPAARCARPRAAGHSCKLAAVPASRLRYRISDGTALEKSESGAYLPQCGTNHSLCV
jgi:hypothetical protein